MKTPTLLDNPMQGKICLVTGSTSGIGLVTARELAQRGARVIVVGRSPERCDSAVEYIRQATGNHAVDYIVTDLSSQTQIRQLAETVMAGYPRLDVLVNNAGGLFVKRQVSVDGLEMAFALNHLGYFLLTNLLLDMIKASLPARIVCVSSAAHYGSKIYFNDLQCEKKYGYMRAYGQSKLANILFTFELARRLKDFPVTANALHPGFVKSNFGRNNGGIVGAGAKVVYLFGISPEKGAQTSIYLATSPEVEGITGKYFTNKKVAKPDPLANDPGTARRLWEVSAELTGLPITSA